MANESKQDKNNLDDTLDWEYMSDFYESDSTNTVRSFEEIAAETIDSSTDADIADDRLLKTVEHVKEIRELSIHGKTAKEITEQLNLDADYVLTILMTLEGYAEDNDLAVARLILFS